MKNLLNKLLRGGVALMLLLTLFNAELDQVDPNPMLHDSVPMIENEDDEDNGMHVGQNDFKIEYFI